MEAFCGSPFWNANTTWLSVSLDLTPCFERTALVWTPCLFLWLLMPMELNVITRRLKKKKMPSGHILKSILTVTACLAILSIIDLITAFRNLNDVHGVDFFSPSLKFVTFMLSSVLLIFGQNGGERSSNLLSMFWFMLLLFGLPQFSKELSFAFSETQMDENPFILDVLYLPLVATNFVLTCLIGPSTENDFERTPSKCPEETCSFISQLTLSWFDRLIWKCRHESLEIADLFELNAEDTCNATWRQLNGHLQLSVDASGRKSEGDVKEYNASILPALIKCFGGAFAIAACLQLLGALMRFLTPHILRLLMDYADSNDPLWKGIAFAGAILAVETAQLLINSRSEYYMSRLEMRMQSALISSLYRKALRLSPAALSESSTGQILNLMTDDARIHLRFLTRVYNSPLMICVAVYLLWNCIGVAVVGGIAVLVCLAPLNHYVSKKLQSFGEEESRTRDKRVSAMNEMLQGIRVLKLYAWEMPFARRVDAIRAEEMKLMDKQSLTDAVVQSAYSIVPVLMNHL